MFCRLSLVFFSTEGRDEGRKKFSLRLDATSSESLGITADGASEGAGRAEEFALANMAATFGGAVHWAALLIVCTAQRRVLIVAWVPRRLGLICQVTRLLNCNRAHSTSYKSGSFDPASGRLLMNEGAALPTHPKVLVLLHSKQKTASLRTWGAGELPS